MPLSALRRFFRSENSGGLLLMAAAALGLVMTNVPALRGAYEALLEVPVVVQAGSFGIHKPLLLWINDGLMAVFFFLVGLELKRELLEGALSRPSRAVLPAGAALMGILVPGILYWAFNHHDPVRLGGWAIPCATDIAFALGVLGLLGSRVPGSLKVFLMLLAVIDDIAVILIIALFYTADLSWAALLVAASCLAVLFAMNRRGVVDVAAYVLVGIVMWASLLHSGVHATLAGVLLAFAIPMRDPKDPDRSPVRSLEHDLHPIVAFVILPVFAFANAGIPLAGVEWSDFLEPVTLGIVVGLFVGKQVAVFSTCLLLVRLRLASLPAGVSWPQLYGVSVLCGIGFTMSLFLASLAFEHDGVQFVESIRLGILVASVASAVVGWSVLRACGRRTAVGDAA